VASLTSIRLSDPCWDPK